MGVDDSFTIPGSGGVLRNKLGLTTQGALDEAANVAATTRWSGMLLEPIPDRLDQAYLQSIHRRLLSPVFDWAGELRPLGVEVQATGTGFVYARSTFFQNGLDEIFGDLAREDYLRGLSDDEFAARLADHWGYLTLTHPFRDGNTRTQSAYVDRLAVRAGHPIDWESVDVPTLRELRLHAAAGHEHQLAQYLGGRLLTPQQYDASVASSLDPTAPRVPLDTVLRGRFTQFPELRFGSTGLILGHAGDEPQR